MANNNKIQLLINHYSIIKIKINNNHNHFSICNKITFNFNKIINNLSKINFNNNHNNNNNRKKLIWKHKLLNNQMTFKLILNRYIVKSKIMRKNNNQLIIYIKNQLIN